MDPALRLAHQPAPDERNPADTASPPPAKARWIRDTSYLRARAAGVPALGRIRAQLTWWVATNRTRDPDNLAQLEKPVFDGLVDAGIVTDDRPALMDKPRAIIRHVDDSAGLVTEPGFTLTITRLGGLS